MNLTQTHIDRFWSGVRILGEDECWPWSGCRNNKGYDSLRIGDKVEGAHCISWFLVNGPIPELFEGLPSQICHRCDRPPCCNPSHLFLGNCSLNHEDCIRKGRYGVRDFRGINNPNVGLTEDIVAKIRKLYDAGNFTQVELGGIFGVKQVAISRMVRGVTWSRIQI